MILLVLPSMAMAAGKNWPPDPAILKPLLIKNFGGNIPHVKTLKSRHVLWTVLKPIHAPGFDKDHPGATWVYSPVNIDVRVKYAVDEIAFFWTSKSRGSTILYRVIREWPGLSNAPVKQIISFNDPGTGVEECAVPQFLVMGLKIKGKWYYDTRKIGFIMHDCGGNGS